MLISTRTFFFCSSKCDICVKSLVAKILTAVKLKKKNVYMGSMLYKAKVTEEVPDPHEAAEKGLEEDSEAAPELLTSVTNAAHSPAARPFKNPTPEEPVPNT